MDSIAKYPKYEMFLTRRIAKNAIKIVSAQNNGFCDSPSPTFSSQKKSKSQSPLSQSITQSCSNSITNIASKIVEREQSGILDLYLIRQQAQQKARLKSDEELGININENLKKMLSNQKEIQTGTKHENNSKGDDEEDSEDADDDIEINLDDYVLTDDEDIDLSESKLVSPAPLAKSETFEALNDSDYDDINDFIDLSHLNDRKTENEPNHASKIEKALLPKKVLNPFYTSNQINKQQHPLRQNAVKKRLIPNIKFETSSSSSSSLSSSTNGVESLDDSFNTLNVSNSPRLSKNSRMAKLNLKRQQNEEKKLEKQKQDKRLRMSQEIQRKQDEIDTKLDELDRSGVELEKTISSIDKNDCEQLKRKEKLEQQLYTLIHEKNLLTRVENELNIQ